MTNLRVAVVGCGRIADAHVGELQKMPGVEIVGVCDLEPIMAEQLARRFGLSHFTDDFEQLLATRTPDVVHITTPPQSHVALATRALDAGAHVYVEKPLALDMDGVETIVGRARETGRKLTVGHSFHFDPPALEMRRLIALGVIGEPVHVESHFGYSLAGPFGAAILGDPRHWVHGLPGRLFHNNVDHMLNKILEFVTDSNPAVHAFATRRRPHTFGDVRDRMHDELRVTILGKSVTGYATFTSHVSPVSHFLRVYGSRGILHADYSIRTVVLEAGPTLPSQIGRLLPAFTRAGEYRRQGWRNVRRFARADFHFFAGMRHLIERFYESIRADTPPPIAYDDMRRLAAVMDTIWDQIARRGGDP